MRSFQAETGRRLRVLLVDDEPPARRRLERLLIDSGRAEVFGSAGNVKEALDIAARGQVDAAFVDVQMPGGDGFSFLERSGDVAIVFVTAFAEFAVRAFEVEALDYLLKPVEPERLALALDRVESSLSNARKTKERTASQVLTLPISTGARFVKLAEVVCVLARDDYTEVVLSDGSSELVSVTMKAWEEELPEGEFLRVHRGTIIARARVTSVERSGSRWVAHLTGHAEPLKVSRDSARHLREANGTRIEDD
jgi:two-component system LytT family response regulator